jgi:hypothetical protein
MLTTKKFIKFAKDNEKFAILCLSLQMILNAVYLTIFFGNFWKTRLGPFVDLQIVLEFIFILSSTALLFIVSLPLHKQLSIIAPRRKYQYITGQVIALGLMIFGSGLHYTADLIRVTADSALAYYLDEILGHQLMYAGLLTFLFITLMTAISTTVPMSLTANERFFLRLLGSMQGIFLALGSLESHVSVITLSIAIMFLITTTVVRRDFYMKQFYQALAFAVVIVLMLWLVNFGGFAEPTALMAIHPLF